MSISSIYNALINQGIPYADARILTAISGAESGFGANQVGAVNSNGTTDYGTFQVNSGAWPQLNPTSLVGANDNTQAAAASTVYNQQGLSAWATYNSGAYTKYLSQVNNAVGSSGDSSSGGMTLSGANMSDLNGSNGVNGGVGGISSDYSGTSGGGVGGISSDYSNVPGYVNPSTASQIAPAIVQAGDSIDTGATTIGKTITAAEGAAAGTGAGWINQLEAYTTSSFVVLAVVVLGVVFVAFGLGLFNKKAVTTIMAG